MIRQSVKYLVPILASSLLIVTACGGGAPVPASVPAKPASESASQPASGPPATRSGPASGPAPSSGTNTTPNQAAAQPANSGSRSGSSQPAQPSNQPTAQPAAPKPSGSGSAPQSAPPAAPAQPQPAAQQPAAPSQQQPNEPRPLWTDRKVIFTTEISLLVRDLTEGVNAVGRFATSAGGFVAGVENREEQGLPVTVVKIRVPPERYEVTMAELRKLGVEVKGEKGTTQDVTDEVSDLQTQITSLEATHKQLLELLSRAQNIDEIFKIRERAD
ncbi:MAG: DUF4349 domain-containing protein, partial [Chloroflexi bacterium]|nr:DUF4349 domain-containing protein [Chloroflexota bacterium]